MSLRFVLCVLLAACATPSEQFVNRLKNACAAQVCPLDPPEYVDCMPPIFDDVRPICGGQCRAFLANACKIEFVE